MSQPSSCRKCSSNITKHREWGGVVGETTKEKGDNQTKQPYLIVHLYSYIHVVSLNKRTTH